jgi:hypothetical protein
MIFTLSELRSPTTYSAVLPLVNATFNLFLLARNLLIKYTTSFEIQSMAFEICIWVWVYGV